MTLLPMMFLTERLIRLAAHSGKVVRCCATAWMVCVTGSAAVAAREASVPGIDRSAQAHESSAVTARDIFQIRLFADPLVPIGGDPGVVETADLKVALDGYAKRSGPDDFSSLTDFLKSHPKSGWRASLLTELGLEYYNTAHYSLTLSAWKEAWDLANGSSDPAAKAVADRAAGELAAMYARLGRMVELSEFLRSTEGRVFTGPATEKITGAREGLWNMQHRPEISFCCGPLALQRIKRSVDALNPCDSIFRNAASTQKGISLLQAAELSKKVGLNYQMAFREGGAFVVPSVVHWKVGHYAALVRQEDDRFLLEDPTFGNTVWATRQALEAETSGYFLIPPGPLPRSWRAVETKAGETVWGKGVTANNDPKPNTPCDPSSAGANQCSSPCPTGRGGGGPSPVPIPYPDPDPVPGSSVPFNFTKLEMSYSPMTQSSVHLMTVNLNLWDTPVGYAPPVGPPIHFTVRYNHREAYQPTLFAYANFGSKWTCDWIAYITDNPSNSLADVNYFVRGGGTRTFTAFDANSQTYAIQQFDQTQLKRTGPASYEMLWPDGSKLIFGQSDGSAGTSRKIFLTQVLDPAGNPVTLNYDGNLRLVNIIDTIGQSTILSYGLTNDIYKITRVTDPFGRFASFNYDALGRLTNITDVIGITSNFSYETNSDFIKTLTTPYGTTTFVRGDNGNTRRLDTIYPDGSQDRVEYNQSTSLGIPNSDPPASLPQGMSTTDQYLYYRNTYYWNRNASATANGDYTRAKIFHWLHDSDGTQTSGILESTKEPLEGRVWLDYAGQNSSINVGTANKPQHIGRVLDDGSTQLYSYSYNGFGHPTSTIDPVGRTYSYFYSTNGIDLLEARMTRAGKNELLFRATYNPQHRPLTTIDAAGQTNFYTYNSRGQILTSTDPKNETTTYIYDTNGYLLSVDGPLPGTSDIVNATYDAYGRMLTETDVSGYTLTFDYDALDRITRITHPDSTYEEFTFDRLDSSVIRDRAGRQTLLVHDSMRQLTSRTDPLGRVNYFQWCSCGDIKSLTDSLGRTTTWHKDVQNRLVSKQYGDGSQVVYNYENTTSRLRQLTDEKQQVTQYSYNRDNTVSSVGYVNSAVPTPAVTYAYDPEYQRVTSMVDGTGMTVYQYVPITTPPVPGAGQLASEMGPLPNDTITYSYDELGRRISTAINGVATLLTFDAAGRLVAETNALGGFTYAYDGASRRILLESFPNGQIVSRTFLDNSHDRVMQRITHQIGATPISEFIYGRDIPAGRIVTWSQQSGASAPDVYSFGYDNADQVFSASVTNSGALINHFAYSYDPAANRLSEQVGSSTVTATYNALNELSAISGGTSSSRTNEWDGKNRLTAVNSGNQRVEFTYDGLDQLASIRLLTNNVLASLRRLVWCDGEICEERDGAGSVTRRFFRNGVKIETGPNSGNYFYTRDHLDSIRELTDSTGNVRARYSYDPYGRRTQTAGDLSADFGFAGMFWVVEARLSFARYRVYDPEIGRWLSRDPLEDAETTEGANLYSYVENNSLNAVDPLGLCCEKERKRLDKLDELIKRVCGEAEFIALQRCSTIAKTPGIYGFDCKEARNAANQSCRFALSSLHDELSEAARNLDLCMRKRCKKPRSCGSRPPWLIDI